MEPPNFDSQSLIKAVASMGDEMIRFGASIENLTRSIGGYVRVLNDQQDEIRAVAPGRWPDEFVLLNRFMRTGERAPFLFNQ